MIRTPRSHANTPQHPVQRGPDVLSEMLNAVRLTGSVFLHASFTAPFGLVSPRYFDPALPQAHLRHVSVLHLIVEGEATLETVDGERRAVRAGELLFLPLADRHSIWNGQPERMATASEVIEAGPIEGMWTVEHGGGGERLRMVCGFLESSELLFAPVFRTLPTLVVERTSEDAVGAHIASTVKAILGLVDAATPGTQAVLGRLMELLFVEVLRRHIARLPAGEKGWFAALNDPVVGRALQLLHADPARRWTTDVLAREVGSSRTVLADRFKALLGRPPIEYATAWRMQLASERLRLGHESLGSIAAGVGYDSEAAFGRAFKRVTGHTPGSWRAGGGSGGPGGVPLRRS
jgi:AraC family transcriptional regulator, alkane utilization regulator